LAYELRFRIHTVDGIDYKINGDTQKIVGRILMKEGMATVEARLGVYPLKTAYRGVHFAFAGVCRQGDYLPVHVRRFDDVAIDEPDPAYPAPAQGLGGIGSHASQAHDRDGAPLKDLKTPAPVKHDASREVILRCRHIFKPAFSSPNTFRALAADTLHISS